MPRTKRKPPFLAPPGSWVTYSALDVLGAFEASLIGTLIGSKLGCRPLVTVQTPANGRPGGVFNEIRQQRDWRYMQYFHEIVKT